MVKQSKIFEVENITAKIKEAKSVTLADYRSLTMAQLNQLRDKLKQAGAELQVIKNTFLLRALRNNNYKIEKEKVIGPSIVLFANQDELAPLKILAAFAKTSSLLPFKIGFMAGKTYLADELSKLAALPPKIELQGKLVGLLASQPSRLVYSLNWNLQRLVIALSAVKNKKQA